MSVSTERAGDVVDQPVAVGVEPERTERLHDAHQIGHDHDQRPGENHDQRDAVSRHERVLRAEPTERAIVPVVEADEKRLQRRRAARRGHAPKGADSGSLR